jgi:hypothetical protein
LKGKRILSSISLLVCFWTLLILTSASVLAEEVFLFSKPLSGVYLRKGDTEERIIYRRGPHIAPRLSPDGERILFHSKRGGEIGIWLTDLQGEGMERLCDGDQASWSPDGERIVFRREDRIMEREIASGRERIITPEDWLSCEFPSYLPDGRVIFVSNGKIFLIDPGKETAPELLIAGEIKSAPKCSPDGKRIAYQDGAHIYLLGLSRQSHIETMDLGDRKTSQLTIAGGVQSWPMWSQDGRSICYCQSPGALDGPWDICNVAIDSPQNVGLVMRDVEISPDWRGSSPPISTMVELKGNTVNSWTQAAKSLIKSIYVLNEEGDITEAISTGSRSRPFVEIKPAENVDRVYVKRNLHLALLPDRFADDLILDPHKYSASSVLLPHTPFLIGLPAESGMILVITPSDKQEVWLIKGEEQGYFEGVEILTGNESVFVAFLPERDLWYRTEVVPDSDGWKTKWSSPFLAQWRIAVAGKEKYYSRMWDEEALSRSSKPSLPIEEDFPELPDLSVIYAYGRSWNTPLDIITPMDILRDTLGIDMLRDVLDIEGIRNYRTAAQWVPLHDLLTSQENRIWPKDSPGWPEVLDFSPFYPLLVRIRMVARKGVESTVTHLCEDILNSLKGLDNRIEEYEEFLDSLESLSVEQAASLSEVEQAASLFRIEESIEDLRDELANLSITEIGEVSDSIEAVKRYMGVGEELWDRDEFYRFWEISGVALSERQKILKKYRDFVKKARNSASIIITEEPNTKDMSEEIRRLTQNILRERYYLEGDWRGEKPLLRK